MVLQGINNSMNLTEKKAYNWLLENGYSNIIYQKTKSPDFIAIKDNKQESFEAKKLYNKTIWFSEGQLERLKAIKAMVLIFNEEAKPKIISSSNLKDGIIENMNIIVKRDVGKQIRISNFIYKKLEQIIDRDGHSSFDSALRILLSKAGEL